MVSTTSTVLAAALAVAGCVSRVQGHGYMLVPESQFKGSATSAWIVQIDPQWPSDDWDGNKQGSVDTYKALAKEKGVTEIRSLLDDTSIYGADCGFTDPDGEAQPIPTDGKATFSRGIVHVGPCEIWLDDTMVLHDDDCYTTYGGEDQDIKSVFPVDYSVCETTGCKEMRFYWLAFQGLSGKTVWQVYKDCIPLKGGSGNGASSSNSTSTATTTAPATETPVADETDAPSTDDEYATDAPSAEASAADEDATDAPSAEASAADEYETEAPEAETPETEAPEAETPATPVPSSKCTARERKRA